jgi:hypothetical protein
MRRFFLRLTFGPVNLPDTVVHFGIGVRLRQE